MNELFRNQTVGLIAVVFYVVTWTACSNQSSDDINVWSAGNGASPVTGGIAGTTTTTAVPAGGNTASFAGRGGASNGAGGKAGTAQAGAGGSSGAAGVSGTSGTAGRTGTVSVIGDADLVAAPDGRDSAPGTLAEPTTLTTAIKKIGAGSTIFLRDGTYAYSEQISIQQSNSGSAGKYKTIRPYNEEKPVLDFSSQARGLTGNKRGLQINASYWQIIGITVEKAADNGMYVAGNNNIIESCVIRGNGDTGLQIGQSGSATDISQWPSNNLILNCESYDNYDSPLGENADGFAAKLTSGTGNVFRGCVSHHNVDDGWDLFTQITSGEIGPVTIDQCIAHHNGTLTDGTSYVSGDRNGFKLGGQGIAVAHVVTRSIAFANGATGFTWNSNPGAIRLINNLSVDNAGGNFVFGSGSQAVFTNNVSLWTSTSNVKNDSVAGNDVSNSNCWWKSSKSSNGKGLTVSAEDFMSPLGNPTIGRNPDGSLDFTPFMLAPGSDLIAAGVVPDGTLPFDAAYYHDTPDLGAVEK